MSSMRRQVLERRADPSYLLSPQDLGVVWTNPAFWQFSVDNGGPDAPSASVLGRPISDFVPSALWPFYKRVYEKVLATGEPARHDYECSSPTEVRWFAQYILPEREGLAIVNARISVAKQGPLRTVEDWAPYVAANGFIRQCCHCRRIKNEATKRWELFLESFEASENTPRTTHGLCEICYAYFFDDEMVPSGVVTYASALPK